MLDKSDSTIDTPSIELNFDIGSWNALRHPKKDGLQGILKIVLETLKVSGRYLGLFESFKMIHIAFFVHFNIPRRYFSSYVFEKVRNYQIRRSSSYLIYFKMANTVI